MEPPPRHFIDTLAPRDRAAAPVARWLERHPRGPPAAHPRLGSAWLASAASALLAVPSAIVEEECNVLVNPAHPDARRLVAAKTRRFLYDPRV